MDLTQYAVVTDPDDDSLIHFSCMSCDKPIFFDDDNMWSESFAPGVYWTLSELLRLASLHAARSHAPALI